MIIASHYNSGFVVSSVLIAAATAYCALEVGPRIRHHTGAARGLWTLLASVCLGGGIWSMHFVAMLGYQPGMGVSYNLALTLLSLLLPIITAIVGFYIIHVNETLSWLRACIVGAVFGAAICGMHYTGMAAMRMNATMEWNWWIVVLSYVIATVASIAAIKTSFMHPTVSTQMAGAALLGVAISGMHYTGMWAMTVIAGGGMYDMGGILIDPTTIGTIIAFVTTIILGTATIAANADRSK